ncbi:MAG: hypothetical protein OEY77_09015 [Nitrospira sp.]|nr:hypothetical protein [Nitrospira sp.]
MHVMIVTHDAERQARLTECLRERGYELSVPVDRQHVLSSLKGEPPHVLVVDLYVVDPCATEILREARREGYRGKVVVMAGPSTSATLLECWQIGIDQVVGNVQVTGGAFDPCCVEVAIRASCEKEVVQRA